MREVSEGDTQKFSLTPRITPCISGIAQITANLTVIIGMIALAFELILTIEALTTCNGKGNNDTITFFQLGDLGSDFLYDSHRLVADNIIFV
ncbi:hypothetical protein D3C77_458060 [compost metagenome]